MTRRRTSRCGEDTSTSERGHKRRPLGTRTALVAAPLVALALTVGLAGCTDTPPEAVGDYPDISNSPAEPPRAAPASERDQVAEGLLADRRENRYAESEGTRQRSSEVRPPEFSPPTEAPADTSLTDRIEAGESPEVARSTLPPPPGAGRDPTVTVPAGTPTPGGFEPSRDPRQQPGPLIQPNTPRFPGPGQLPPPPVPNAYAGGPVIVDSRGVSRTGPSGMGAMPGGYAAASAATIAPGAMVGPAGAQPLAAYGPMPGARSQRVAVIYFADGSSRLSGQDRQVLSQVAALQRQYGGVLRVVGHASSRTGATDIARHKLANFNVSLARANNVADALMRSGVPGQFLFVGAASDSQPVYYEIMPTGEAGNRRTEIYLDY
ncbi:OmpA family protein [Roseospira navarrensis]|uniref:OmpA family protein n=1 Tax=Roseospira navarrensis TaxID=140058 RepID=A0A7X1ZC16_9PROT|nr:OmpA family protein [Roseospira navarrensis]